MSERPILFNGDMVQAILDGRKTMTRRPVTLTAKQKEAVDKQSRESYIEYPQVLKYCPFGGPGTVLYVRETWMPARDGDTGETIAIYRADWKANGKPEGPDGGKHKWRPSIHMPRKHARIFLRVKRVRVHQIQDISEADAIAEGLYTFSCELPPNPPGERITYYGLIDYTPQTNENPAFAFRDLLWNPIYATKGLGWADNPWVFACEFEREKP